MYYTYVLFSQVDQKLYIGWTHDLRNRIKSHNKGEVNATKLRKPLELIYYEACLSKEKAIERERETIKNRIWESVFKEKVINYCGIV